METAVPEGESTRPPASAQVEARGERLTVRRVQEILAEESAGRARAPAAHTEDDLHAVLAFVEGEPASGLVR